MYHKLGVIDLPLSVVNIILSLRIKAVKATQNNPKYPLMGMGRFWSAKQ
jgi:hypothetical protein